jgi:hypothetical protein
MAKLVTTTSAILGVAVWFLLFVILGTGLGIAFIAGGCAWAAGALAAGMAAGPLHGIVDAPLTSAGLLSGIAAFVILQVVLSVSMWIAVVTGLAVIGLYSMLDTAFHATRGAEQDDAAIGHEQPLGAMTPSWRGNGHEQGAREPVGAR